MKNTNPEAIIRLGDLDGARLIQKPDGYITTILEHFDFDPLTGIASVTSDDPNVPVKTWQCNLVVQDSNVIGWAWPTASLAQLPVPDIVITDLAENVTGRAYSMPIPYYFDVPILNLQTNVTHYAAAVKFPGIVYTEAVDTSNTNTTHYYLAP